MSSRAAPWEAVCEHELEGVVAKRLSGRYLVKAHRDAQERDQARLALVELGLGVAPA